MASWTEIPNSSLETGTPARSVDALAFRDNPVAIAEGAIGAPRIQTLGLANECVTPEKLKNFTAGTAYNIITGGNASIAQSSTYQNLRQFEILLPGVITVYTGISNSDSDGSCGVQVRKNGSVVTTFSKGGSGTQYYSVDVTVNAGDKIELWGADFDSDSGVFSIVNPSIKSNTNFKFGAR